MVTKPMFHQPKGVSINNFTPPNVYLNTVYKLQYPTIDNITEALVSLGQGAYLYKIDLSRAFCQLRIDPMDYNLLCLKWGDSYYSDAFLSIWPQSQKYGLYTPF